jgi:hypothetical protein
MLDSYERIQGNPSLSNPHNQGFGGQTARAHENPNRVDRAEPRGHRGEELNRLHPNAKRSLEREQAPQSAREGRTLRRIESDLTEGVELPMGFLFPDRDAAADGHVKSPPFPRDAGDGLDVVKGAVRLQRSDQQAGRWPVFFPQHGPVLSQAIQAMNAPDHRLRGSEKAKDRDQARRIVDVNAPAPVVWTP